MSMYRSLVYKERCNCVRPEGLCSMIETPVTCIYCLHREWNTEMYAMRGRRNPRPPIYTHMYFKVNKDSYRWKIPPEPMAY